MLIGGKQFKTKGHTYVMGILNMTPDSFSDGGVNLGEDVAIRNVERMLAEGADIIDVGGESTRPGHVQISDEEEIERTAGIIQQIKREFGAVVSIDTYKSRVAQAAIQAGADLVNDIWGLKADDAMADLIADSGVACCLMHNREQQLSTREPIKTQIMADMQQSIELAREAAIPTDKIILDPGIGFAKSYDQNIEVLGADNFMMPEGYPVLLGTSRKSVIGLTLDLPTSERLEGTLVTTTLAVQQGCMFVRVHDVKENCRAIRMMERIMYGKEL